MTEREKLMARDRTITIDVLREFLDCDFDTGQMVWRKRHQDWFSSLRACNAWNVARAAIAALRTAVLYQFEIMVNK